jgi:hypothetical protein
VRELTNIALSHGGTVTDNQQNASFVVLWDDEVDGTLDREVCYSGFDMNWFYWFKLRCYSLNPCYHSLFCSCKKNTFVPWKFGLTRRMVKLLYTGGIIPTLMMNGFPHRMCNVLKFLIQTHTVISI